MSVSNRRVALVAGAAGAFGLSVCEALAQRQTDLVLGVRTPGGSIDHHADRFRRLGSAVFVDQLNVTEPGNIAGWVSRAHAHFGRIDVLANCLGWQDPAGFLSFIEQDEVNWMRVLEVELLASMRLAQSVVPLMIQRRWGRIVTVGSDSAKVGESGAAANSAARGGCSAFTKALAREVGRHGLTVNMICPGPTESPLLTRLAETPKGAGKIAKMISMTAVKRLGVPQDVANAVAFLASEEASFITGQVLSVSGGLTMC